MREAAVEFDDYMYFYSGYGNQCDLDYSINGSGRGSNLKNLEHLRLGGARDHDLPAAALGQAEVQLRFHRYGRAIRTTRRSSTTSR